MPTFFFDTSAIVKRYVNEVGTGWVCGVTDPPAANTIYVAGVTAVEVVAAVARRRRAGSLNPSDAAGVVADFRHDLASQYRVVEIRSDLLREAMDLANSHALRGYDAVQLAAALEVNRWCARLSLAPPTIVAADRDLLAASLAEGLIVEDPNTHS